MVPGRFSFAVAIVLTLATFDLARAAPPAPAKITPELVAAARKEGVVRWYASTELSLTEAVGKAFEAKYPGIKVEVERSGAERNYQRIGQEYGSGIHNVDVVESSDGTNFLDWKKQGWLTPFVPEDSTYLKPDQRDPDGQFAVWRSTFSIMGYNTRLVRPEEAPKSFADLLDPRWSGKLVKAHPGYSGTILTATYEIMRVLGWSFFEKLGKQHVMQVQSANDPPRKLEAGERAVMVDGVEYLFLTEKAKGAPIVPIYPTEGTPFIPGSCAVMKDAPHPNAARLLLSFLLGQEAQQLIVDRGGLRSLHPGIKERGDRPPLSAIKRLPDDPAGTAAMAEEIKRRYAEYFGI